MQKILSIVFPGVMKLRLRLSVLVVLVFAVLFLGSATLLAIPEKNHGIEASTAKEQSHLPLQKQYTDKQGVVHEAPLSDEHNKEAVAGEHLQSLEPAPEDASPDSHEKSGFKMEEVIAHHLGDQKLWDIQVNVAGSQIDMSITKRVVMMWIASLFMLMIFIPAARKIAKRPYNKPSRFTGIVEVFTHFIRDNVGKSSMGHHSGHYEPFLLTLFFFVLFSNLLGLVPPLGELAQLSAESMGWVHHADGHDGLHLPILVKLWPGITPTGDISVTAALAGISFFVILLAGFAHQGALFIRNIVPKGIPLALWPLMWVVEFVGQFTKPFALAIRLLANMTAGHLIILALMGFIFQFESYYVAPASILSSVAIYLLELFVAFLQAYIFVFLTALFISQVQHRH